MASLLESISAAAITELFDGRRALLAVPELSAMLRSFGLHDLEKPHQPMAVRNFTPMLRSALWEQLLANGWCPSHLVRLWPRLNTSCLYYLLHHACPRPHQKHKILYGARETETMYCTASRCTHRLLDNSAYRTAHAERCSGASSLAQRERSLSISTPMDRPLHQVQEHLACPMASVNHDALYDYLERDAIPLVVSVNESEPADLHIIQLTYTKASTEYIAISHV